MHHTAASAQREEADGTLSMQHRPSSADPILRRVGYQFAGGFTLVIGTQSPKRQSGNPTSLRVNLQ